MEAPPRVKKGSVAEVDDLNTKIDRAAAKIAKLKETIALLEKELGKIAAEQKTADETRMAEKVPLP